MYTIGISYGYHESAVAVLKDASLIFASTEERFSRLKSDPRFPVNALQYALKHFEINQQNLQEIVYYERPELKIRRVYNELKRKGDENRLPFILAKWLKEGRIDPGFEISAQTGFSTDLVSFAGHHESHARTAFEMSPFSDAAVLIVDGVGEEQTLSIYAADDSKINLLKESKYPHSIGLIYAAFTHFLGFNSNEDEYKVMGLSAYGQPRYDHHIKQIIKINENFDLDLDKSWIEYAGDKASFTPKFFEVFGEPLASDWRFRDATLGAEHEVIFRRAADIAASLQVVLEDLISRLVHISHKLSGMTNICIGGGVALNGLAIGKVLREAKEKGTRVFLYSSPGDAGSAIGAAYTSSWVQHGRSNNKQHNGNSVYLGLDVVEDPSLADVARSVYFKKILNENDRINLAAKHLAEGLVIGHVIGRAEFGPRALGNRSILASPRDSEIKNRVNLKIKYRESYRPFAPSVLAEYANDLFHLADLGIQEEYNPYCFMLAVVKVRDNWVHKIPGIVHEDGTARVQVLHRNQNPRFHALLTEFNRITGLPVLLNTSFNLNGEPIVNTARDAIRTFEASNIDALFCEGYYCTRL